MPLGRFRSKAVPMGASATQASSIFMSGSTWHPSLSILYVALTKAHIYIYI